MKMKTNPFYFLLAITIALFSSSNFCQAQTASVPYGEVAFIKVAPGMNDNYLAACKILKKLNNGRKAAKAIDTWQLYKRVYPMHEGLDYDFATFEVFPSGKEMQARKELTAWDAPLKDLTAKEISTSIGSLNGIRTVLDRDVYSFRMGAGTSVKAGDYMLLSRVKATAGNLDAYEKTLETLKPVVEEAIKAGKLKSWNVWKRTLATNVDGDTDFTVAFSFGSMDEALAYASEKVTVAAEFKKLYPKDEFAAFRIKQVALRNMVKQELWELIDITD